MKRILRALFERIARGQDTILRAVFADASTWQSRPGTPALTIVFRTARAERNTVLLGYVGFFEAWFDAEIDLVGERPAGLLMRLAYGSAYRYGANPLLTLMRRRLEARDDNRDRARAQANARHHYGMPHAFFHLMLGEACLYAEGLWHDATTTLAEAQANRCEAICRKLRLAPGQRLVEVGSGWGEMALHAAEHHGVEVVNYGLVPEQNRVMAERIAARGLTGRVTIVEKDHRDLAAEPGAYDRYLSVGVYEHAGHTCQKTWIEGIATALKPGGIGLISTTSYMAQFPTEYLTIKYIFPGGAVPSLPRALDLLDDAGLHVVRLEELGWHYQRTAEAWLANVEASWDAIVAIDPVRFTERFRRIWTYYLEGVIEGFRAGGSGLDLHHITFTKGRVPYPLEPIPPAG
ncbi:cyclopropane-fatty-acyl-phospholipid synthase family protein [Elioraea sp.]|uniref:SAM-dependent methyltransferase n=1 Tax=Elioraea sp. TaxID=2185103 RepID=UPI0025C29DF8|nr:cyclopropane-fatty-acyl-phospholipid synthase family protein [Elioraea sp.]